MNNFLDVSQLNWRRSSRVGVTLITAAATAAVMVALGFCLGCFVALVGPGALPVFLVGLGVGLVIKPLFNSL